MLRTVIWVNLLGNWVSLNASDKVQGTLAYNWAAREDIHTLKDEYIGIVHGGAEYIIHKSCVQFQFVNAD